MLATGGQDASSIVLEVLHSPGQPLDAETRAFMESRFGNYFSRVRTHPPARQAAQSDMTIGRINDPIKRESDCVTGQGTHGITPTSGEAYDLSQVRIHTGERAAESARAVNALAYTVGNDIIFGAGRYAPATHQGQWLIAHELTHVIQQTDRSEPLIQRDCSDPDFCKPYASTAEADSAEWWIRNTRIYG